MALLAVGCSALLWRSVGAFAPRGKLAREKPRLPRAKPDASTCRARATLKRQKPKTTRKFAREKPRFNGQKPDASTCRKRRDFKRQINPITRTRFRTAPQRQAHPPPEAKRGTNGAVGGRVQRLVQPLLKSLSDEFSYLSDDNTVINCIGGKMGSELGVVLLPSI